MKTTNIKRIIASILILNLCFLHLFSAVANGVNKVEIIIDNTDIGFRSDSAWTPSTYLPGYYGENYISTSQDPNKWVKWTPYIGIPGEYNIYIKYSGTSSAQPPAVPLEIKYDGGIDTAKKVDMNNASLNNKWVFIGTYKLETGNKSYVKMTASGKGTTVADAAKFVLASTDDPEAMKVVPQVAPENDQTTEIKDGIVDQNVKKDTGIAEDRKVIPAVLTIDENTIIRKADRALLGYNNEWREERGIITDSENSIGVSQDYLDVLNDFKLPMPANRYAGTSSQFFKWKLSLGEPEERTTHALINYGQSSDFPALGIIEALNSVLKVDPNGEFVFVLNFDKETPEDWADFAEFLLGDGKTNINGGRNWAQKRIQLGIKEPVKVMIWELGNEMDWGSFRSKFDIDTYTKTCKEAIKAIRSVDANAKFSAHAATGPWSDAAVKVPGYTNWRGWHQFVLKELGSEIDYVSLHPYYLGLPISVVETYISAITEDIQSITGTDKIKVFVSEHSTWMSNLDDKKTWAENTSLQGALGAAQFYTRLFNTTDVGAAMYHCFSGGPWGIVRKENEKRYMTAIADMFKVVNQGLGQDVVTTTITGDYADPQKEDNNLTAFTMTTDKGLNIVLVNRNYISERQLQFNFKNNYKLVKETVLTGERKESENTLNHKGIQVTTTEKTDTIPFTSYLMPDKSIVVLHLEKIESTAAEMAKVKMSNAIVLRVGSGNALVNAVSKRVDAENPQVAPTVMDGRTLVPLRFIAESLGAKVEWHEATQSATVSLDSHVVQITLGKKEYLIDGALKELDVTATAENGRIMMPLRAMAEAVGKKVFWDSKGLIVISDVDNILTPDKDEAVIEELIKLLGN